MKTEPGAGGWGRNGRGSRFASDFSRRTRGGKKENRSKQPRVSGGAKRIHRDSHLFSRNTVQKRDGHEKVTGSSSGERRNRSSNSWRGRFATKEKGSPAKPQATGQVISQGRARPKGAGGKVGTTSRGSFLRSYLILKNGTFNDW